MRATVSTLATRALMGVAERQMLQRKRGGGPIFGNLIAQEVATRRQRGTPRLVLTIFLGSAMITFMDRPTAA